jgi:Activator of Hsp90 ATPase homolog 1-like protein
MELKTKIIAEDGQQDMRITREFDLPLELLFKAHAEPALIEQWMGTKVLKFESKKHGSYQFKTTDGQGKVVFQANGAIHEFNPDTPFGVQLEILEFEALTEHTSKLTMHVIYESVGQRDQILKIGMVQGINMAHNRLQEIAGKLK